MTVVHLVSPISARARQAGMCRRTRHRWTGRTAPASWIVRLALIVGLATADGCAPHRGLPPLSTIAPSPPLQLTASLSATVRREPQSILLQVTDGRISLLTPTDTDSLAPDAVRDLSLRAVLAADSSGRLIPVGVSSPYLAPGVLRRGEVRELRGAEFALPVPEGVRLAEVWVVFELRGVGEDAGGSEAPVTSLVCSSGPLAPSRSPAALRFSDRLRAQHADACRL